MVREQIIKDSYALYNGDCCEVIKTLPDKSIGFSVFSPPFGSLYSYSDSDKDMSNSKSYKEFLEHFGFLIEELYRVLMDGRAIAVHCMDLPQLKSQEGIISLRDFPGDIIRLFRKYDFVYHSRHAIWKDPLLAAVRTHAIGLAHKQIVKDSVVCRTGLLDYILVFRKKGDNLKPIEHPEGLKTYSGSREIPSRLRSFEGHKDQGTNKLSHWIWQQYASPVWFDIRQTNVLSYTEGKDKDDARHICPLQLDVIDRCLELWSAKGDTVLTPFMGIGSEVYCAVKNKRKGVGIELKKSYFNQAVRNLKSLDI